ncbi:unnamed protein product [Ectocarpus sp. CCAP 1310/34]|nr:unnamed protein product [Ectocarpus sp. CCAP 1310/34]
MTAEGFHEYLNKNVLPQAADTKTCDYNPFKHAPVTKTTTETASGEIGVSYSVTVCTARSWLHKLGCEYRDRKSGLYFNGHDREDVLAYRVEKYLPAYFEHRDYMEIWIEATSDEARSWEVQVQEQDRQEVGRVWVCVHAFKETLSELPQHLCERVTSKKTYSNGRRAIFCYQDECIYRANDGQRSAWVPPNYHALKKKGDGQGIMISGTIVDNVGFVAGGQADIDEAQALRRKWCDTSATEHAAGDPTKPETYRNIDKLYKDEDGKFWTYYRFE